MSRRTALAAGTLTTVLLALSPAAALAGDIRVDTSAAGVKRLLFSESRDAAGVRQPEVNRITVKLTGGSFVVTDAGTPLTPGAGCVQGSSPSEAICSADGVIRLVFTLGFLNDSFDNQTATAAQVSGDTGSDRIVNSGGGDDTVESAGNELDEIVSCGAGNDTVNTDGRDIISADSGCEVINGVPQGGPQPNPGAPGAPLPPPAQQPVNPAPAGTPAPEPVAALGAAPPQGACKVQFIGTAAADRIDGSSDGDYEYGLAGNDFLKGQGADDCLSGGDGNDTMIGDDGLDTLAGGPGDDVGYGGNGNDKLFGNAGADRLFGNAGNDRLSGAAGDDRLYGDLGDDLLYGSAGNDRLSGGAGKDTLSGGDGRDQLFGAAGADTLNGGLSSDVLSAGAGNDRVNAQDRRRDVIRCGAGRDVVVADRNDSVSRDCENVTRR